MVLTMTLNSQWLDVAKAQKSALDRARKLIALKVNEVSVVDRPAILREFLLIKRLEETDMPNEQRKEAVEAALANVTKLFEQGGFQAVQGELPAELKKDAAAVVEWMQKMAEGTEDETVKASILNTAALLSKFEQGEFVTPKAQEEDKEKADAGEGEGEEGEGEKQAAASSETEKAQPGESKMPDAPFGKKKEKALSLEGAEPEGGLSIHVSEDGQIQIRQKGLSAEAKEVATTKAAFLAVAEQLANLSKEALTKAVQEVIEKAELPKDAMVSSAVRPQGTGAKPSAGQMGVDMTKSAGSDATQEAFAELKKSLEKVTAEVETIKKARNPSTSLDGEGATEGAEQNVQKAFWSGVL